MRNAARLTWWVLLLLPLLLFAQRGAAHSLSLFEATKGYTDRLTGLVLGPLSGFATRIGTALPLALATAIAISPSASWSASRASSSMASSAARPRSTGCPRISLRPSASSCGSASSSSG